MRLARLALLAAPLFVQGQAPRTAPGIRVIPITNANPADSAETRVEARRLTEAINEALRRDAAVQWLPIPEAGQRMVGTHIPAARFIVTGVVRAAPDSTVHLAWHLVNVETSEIVVRDSTVVVPHAEDLASSEIRTKVDLALGRHAAPKSR